MARRVRHRAAMNSRPGSTNASVVGSGTGGGGVSGPALSEVSNGMDAPTRNGIDVPKSKRYINHLNREGRPP